MQISGDSTAADNLELAFDGTGYAGGTIPQQVVLTTNGVNAVADGVWDEDITGHRAANAAGAMLQPLHSGACQAGGNTTTVVLASTASSADDYYNGDLLAGWITADGTGQFADYILDYVGATRTATVTGIGVSPTTTSTYVIHPGGTIPGASAPAASDNAAAVWNAVTASFTAAGSFGQAMGGEVTRANTAQAGTTSSITLRRECERHDQPVPLPSRRDPRRHGCRAVELRHGLQRHQQGADRGPGLRGRPEQRLDLHSAQSGSRRRHAGHRG